SASCLALSALTFGVAKWPSGTVEASRCGCAICAAGGTPTWEWMSMVVSFGRPSRPCLPCLRAAVGPYRLVSVTFLLLGHSGAPRSGEPGIHKHDFQLSCSVIQR